MNTTRKFAIAVFILLCIAAGLALRHATVPKPSPAADTNGLPTVVVTAKKEAAPESLPTVTVIGKRLSAAEKIHLALQDAVAAAKQWVASGETDRAAGENG